MRAFVMRRLGIVLCASGIFFSTQTIASGFQIFEQDGASLGNYHAGYAAIANDASTAFYNPAGIPRIKNQQFTFGAVSVLTDVKYTGTLRVNTISNNALQPVTGQGGSFNLIPSLNYVAPLDDRAGFGFSIVVPFGAKTDYGKSTILRYVSTETSVFVIDFSPSLGLRLTDKFSIGLGLDIQRMYGEFNQVATLGGDELDSDGINKANDTAYGYHLGGLYEITPQTRVGLSYHSQVVHHLSGTSTFAGPLAEALDAPPLRSRSLLDITLPAYTALSIYHQLHPKVALMGSVIYTQWNSVQNIVLQNVAGIAPGVVPSTSIIVTIPQRYHNTWNISLGANYYATDDIMLRGGLGYDQAPVSNAYRTVQLPDKNRYIIALGGHYQASKTIGLDLGWSHVFINKAHISPPVQVTGAEQVTTDGSVTGGADLYSAQLTWDIV